LTVGEGFSRYHGLIAATFTPMQADGALDLGAIAPMTETILARGVTGLYVCGSTGEGLSLSVAERKAVAAEFVRAAAGRVPVIVQVGHESLTEARGLAKHAAIAGADAISAIPPTYFQLRDVAMVVECARVVAEAAPALDFFYYHIPAMTGVEVGVADLVERCLDAIPSFAGVKFSDTRVFEMALCAENYGDRAALLFGTDEMLLSGLVGGAHGAVGSTYNFLTREAREVLDAYEAGDIAGAERAQRALTRAITSIVALGGLPALKAAMSASGVECGPPRLPLLPVGSDVEARLSKLLRVDLAADRPKESS
jgi:N-acetylneuraminate lyase